MLDRSREWVEADLLQLIATQVPESVALEYKRAAALSKEDSEKKDKIRKTVSAFANSAGGVVVYGMAENGHVPTQLDPVDPHAFSKEWLENVIISNVQPRIDGLHINPVLLSGANAGCAAYVVTVPQSLTAHQAPDHRYYKRFNFQSVPMEHYEVQDTMNRAKTPIIEVQITRQIEKQDADLHRYLLTFHLENKGARAAQHMKLVLWFPRDLNPQVHRHPAHTVKPARGSHDQPYQAREYVLPLSDAVLFPLDTCDLQQRTGFAIRFEVNDERKDFLDANEPKIEWIVYADDMVPRQDSRLLSEFVVF
jgi:hypothetical protein